MWAFTQQDKNCDKCNKKDMKRKKREVDYSTVLADTSVLEMHLGIVQTANLTG